MVDKVNGMAGAGQFLSGGLDFYTVRTTLDIMPSTDGDITEAGQKRLDKLVETISLRAQPVFLGTVKSAVEATEATDIPAHTGGGTVYTVVFAVEHNKVWETEELGNDQPTLAETLNGVEGFVFNPADTSADNVAIALTAL